MAVQTPLDVRQVLERINAVMRELEALRRELLLPTQATPPNMTEQLFGAAGHGTREEYDLNLDWARFAEWSLR